MPEQGTWQPSLAAACHLTQGQSCLFWKKAQLAPMRLGKHCALTWTSSTASEVELPSHQRGETGSLFHTVLYAYMSPSFYSQAVKSFVQRYAWNICMLMILVCNWDYPSISCSIWNAVPKGEEESVPALRNVQSEPATVVWPLVTFQPVFPYTFQKQTVVSPSSAVSGF